MQTTTVIRVLLADDQRLVLEGIAALLQEHDDLKIVGLAGSGQEAIRLAAEVKPDVVLMDIRMPAMSGIEALRWIHQHQPVCRVLMLTTFNDDDYIVEALQQGAVGYLLKDLPAAELADAIRAAFQGRYSFDQATGQRLAHLMGRRAPMSPASTEEIPLSEREREVVLLVARGFSNRDIALQLTISEGTVKNHLSNILAALNFTSRAQIIVYAYERGLIQLP